MLIQHLKSPDFFDVENHPTAAFEITGSKSLPDPVGSPNFLLECKLTIRGVTQPLEVLAVVACAGPGRITGQCQFEVDRTVFGSRYGSGSFFSFLGKHVVNDRFHLHVKLHADRVEA
jgi:polyisoprenoid-binding protein YceI